MSSRAHRANRSLAGFLVGLVIVLVMAWLIQSGIWLHASNVLAQWWVDTFLIPRR